MRSETMLSIPPTTGGRQALGSVREAVLADCRAVFEPAAIAAPTEEEMVLTLRLRESAFKLKDIFMS
jgi:hypothetical protein